MAVRDTAFAEPQQPPPRLRFLVAWNGAEGAFAVTCHGRAEAAAQAPQSWAGLFSAPALRGVHRQLSAVCPRLEPAFPELPPALPGAAAGGLWAVLFPGGAAPGEAELQELCRALELYLGWALELCGARLVLDALFAADRCCDDEYFESLHELRGKALRGHLGRAKEALRRVRAPGPGTGRREPGPRGLRGRELPGHPLRAGEGAPRCRIVFSARCCSSAHLSEPQLGAPGSSGSCHCCCGISSIRAGSPGSGERG